MRWLIVAAALACAAPLEAQSPVRLETDVFVERDGEQGPKVLPAERLLRGDRVVTVLTWQVPRQASYTLTSAVPAGLALESTSRADLLVSTDGGRSWTRLDEAAPLPRGVTHLRWQATRGAGRLSYRAVVR